MFGISIWDIIGYHMDICGYLDGYCQDIPSISIDLPPVSRAIHLLIQRYPSTYPEISICLSRDIHLLIQRYPSIFPELSIYLSRDIHKPIQSYPSTSGYPEISCWIFILFWLVLLAAACSCCDSSCIAFTQATTCRCLRSRPGDGAARQVGARRQGVTTPGPAAAARSNGTPRRPPRRPVCRRAAVAAAAAAASAASTADTRLPMRGGAEDSEGWDKGMGIGCNGMVKA